MSSQTETEHPTTNAPNWVIPVAWLLAAGLAVTAGVLWLFDREQPASVPVAVEAVFDSADWEQELSALPPYVAADKAEVIGRGAVYDTVVPHRARVAAETYIVEFGDSVFGIADKFSITPETLLWANYDVLNDNPDFLEPGMKLTIPPLDGVYYLWVFGDTLESVAERFATEPDDIVQWVGNQLDLVNPVVEAGQYVMVPGGVREYRQWVIPVIARGSAGVSAALYGPGACDGSYEGAYGSGAFAWPSPIHELVGNDYWSGHLALDIASGEGVPVLAADSGVVVFSGWANGGYGYMVMIDHGNGYATLYAHMSQVTIYCGTSVSTGQTLGYGGTTGNSTGPHLHFEVRYLDGFINPWFVLP